MDAKPGATFEMRLWAMGYGLWALEVRLRRALCCNRRQRRLAGVAGIKHDTSPQGDTRYSYLNSHISYLYQQSPQGDNGIVNFLFLSFPFYDRITGKI